MGNHFFLRLSLTNLLVSNLYKPPPPRGTARSTHRWLPSSSGLSPSSSLCAGIRQGLRGRAQSLPAPHFPPHPPCILPFSFHSHVNSSPLRAKKKERTWPRSRKCSPVCQGEERREIKANKASESKIPKPPLRHPAAVKVNTGSRQRGGKPIPNTTQAAAESGIHRPSTAAFPRA